MSKKTGYVPSTFKDAGTGETFEGGRDHEFEPGAYANYKAAGKIGDKPSAKATEAKAGDAKTS